MKKNKKQSNLSRYTAFTIAMTIIFSAILSKLVYLQVIKAEDYRETANKNSHKVLSKVSPRGEILDRNGVTLATSRQSSILIFTETSESKKDFFKTMGKVFKIMDENGEIQQDDFALKVEPFRLDFNTSGDTTWNELRFKKDRGLDYQVIKDLYNEKKREELSDAEWKKVDDELLKITPEEVFNDLILEYKIYDLYKEDFMNQQWDKLSESQKKNSTKSKWIEDNAHLWDDKDKKEKIDLLLKNYDLNTIRRYMLVKDTIKMQSFSGYKPVVVANDLKQETAFIFEQIQSELPGISIIKQPIREYPYKDLASSVIGYIRKISPWEQDKFEEKGYDASTDYVGAAGIEGVYESLLRGTKGQESIEINKYGRKVKTLGQLTPYPGKSIELTLDKNLQLMAERALDDAMANLQKKGNKKAGGGIDDVDTANATRGAAVVVDVNSGAILALASKPGYDPNLFAVPGRLNDEEYRKFFMPDLDKFGREYIEKRGLNNRNDFMGMDISKMTKEEKTEYILNALFPLDKRIENNKTIREDYYDIYPKPFYNYATNSLIPPGSTFKPLTGIAGLEEGVIEKDTKILDNGPFNKRYKSFSGASWMWNLYHGSHGWQNVMEALRDSNNYFFFDVADRLFEKFGVETKDGLNALAKYAWKFGLGENPEGNPKYSTGIELPENFGQVYNYESGKNILSTFTMRSLYDYLQKGEASIWVGNYKGIDIVPRDKDPDNIRRIKDKLTDEIKKEMREAKRKDFDIIIGDLLRELIDKSPELKAKGYTDSDITGMINAIGSSVNDARAEIKSGVNLYNASIGQGLDQFTPLQMVNYISTIVNGGHRYKLHLVDKIMEPDGKVIQDNSKDPVVLEETGVSKETVEAIKQGMLEVTSSPLGGTAYNAFKGFPISNGGKTGSATFSNVQDSFGRTSYGVFVGFAPYENPEIAVYVVIFDGGHGGYVAPVARAVYEEYFKDDIKKIKPDYQFMYNVKDEESKLGITSSEEEVEKPKTGSPIDEKINEETNTKNKESTKTDELKSIENQNKVHLNESHD